MIWRTLTCLFLFFTITLHAQKVKFGKFSAEDLTMKQCSFEPDAGALVLSDIGNSYVSFSITAGVQYVYTRHVRIKIFNSSGYDAADISIPVYLGNYNAYYDLDQLKAHTIVSSDGKEIEKIPVEKKQIYEEQTSEHWKRIKFAFPAVDDGCIIEYKYRIVTSSLSAISNWEMQREFPTKYTKFTCEIPDVFKSQVNVTGQSSHLVSVEQSSQSSEGVLMNTYAFEARDLPGLPYEKYGTMLKNYGTRARTVLLYLSVPGRTTEFIDGNYEKLNERWIEWERYKILGKKRGFLDEAAAKIANGDSEFETIRNTVNYLRKNSIYNEYDYSYPNHTVKNTLSKEPSNSAAINMALIMLLQHKGIDANPLITSTRNFYQPHPVYPARSEFNQLLTIIKLQNGKNHIINGASKLPYGAPAPSEYNKIGWKLSKDAGEVIEIEKILKANLYAKTDYTFENGTLNQTTTFNGNHLGMHLSSDGTSLESDAFIDHLKSSSEDVADVQVEKNFKSSKLTINYEPKQIEEDANIYITPTYYGLVDFDVFKPEHRRTPIDFPYANNVTNIINIAIPPGYALESMPKPTQLKNIDGSIKCAMVAQHSNDQVSINLRIKSTKNFFLPSEYADLRSFMNHVENLLNEKVIFIKQTE